MNHVDLEALKAVFKNCTGDSVTFSRTPKGQLLLVPTDNTKDKPLPQREKPGPSLLESIAAEHANKPKPLAGQKSLAFHEQEDSSEPHPTHTPEFKAWHAGSHVVHPDGTPMVVYHSTNSPHDFDQFQSQVSTRTYHLDGEEIQRADPEHLGEDSSGHPDRYHYGAIADALTLGPEKALEHRRQDFARYPDSEYRHDMNRHLRDLERMQGKKIETGHAVRPDGSGSWHTPSEYYGFFANAGALGEHARIIPSYLSIKNPKYMNGAEIESAGRPWMRDKLIAEGYDGAIYKPDPKDLSKSQWGEHTQIVAFHPHQVKSVFNRKPTEDPRLHFSRDIDNIGPVEFSALPKQPFRRLIDKKRSAADVRGRKHPTDNGDKGWTKVGGSSVHVDDEGVIDKGCPGLLGEAVEDLIDESDESRERREARQHHAYAAGITGDQLTPAQAKAMGSDAHVAEYRKDLEAAKAHPSPTVSATDIARGYDDNTGAPVNEPEPSQPPQPSQPTQQPAQQPAQSNHDSSRETDSRLRPYKFWMNSSLSQILGGAPPRPEWLKPKNPHYEEWRDEYETVRHAAAQYGVAMADILTAIPEAHTLMLQNAVERERAKTRARKLTGLTSGKQGIYENAYKDYSTVPRFDETSREFAAEHPEMGFDPNAHDTPQKVWEFIREGAESIPDSDSREVADFAAAMLAGRRRRYDLAGDTIPPFESEDENEPDVAADEDGDASFDPSQWSRQSRRFDLANETNQSQQFSSDEPHFDFSHDDTDSYGEIRTTKVGPATIVHRMAPGGIVELNSLRVPHRLRGRGHADNAMSAFTSAIDASGKASSLLASPLDKHTKLSKLVEFYRKHGYAVGKPGNQAGDPYMHRPAAATEFSRSESIESLADSLGVPVSAVEAAIADMPGSRGESIKSLRRLAENPSRRGIVRDSRGRVIGYVTKHGDRLQFRDADSRAKGTASRGSDRTTFRNPNGYINGTVQQFARPIDAVGPIEKHHDTELSHEDDYKQNGHRSKAFKSWFGDWESEPHNASKVVHRETGEPHPSHSIPGEGKNVGTPAKPITVYHGTGKGGWTAFDKSRIASSTAGWNGDHLLYGPGFYFTEDESVASEYAKIGDKDVYHTTATREQIADTVKRTRDALHREHGLWKQAGMGHDAVHLRSAIDHLDGIERLSKIPKASFEDNQDVLRAVKNLAQMTDGTESPVDHSHIEKRRSGEVKSVYLNIRNPFDIDGKTKLPMSGKAFVDRFGEGVGRRIWNNYGYTFDRTGDGHFSVPNSIAYHAAVEHGNGKAAANDWLKSMGHDGITHVGGNIMGDKKHQVWIAFEPHQIKSVNNRGTFDKNNHDIHFSRPLGDIGPVEFAQMQLPFDSPKSKRPQITKTAEGHHEIDLPQSNTYPKFRARFIHRPDGKTDIVDTKDPSWRRGAIPTHMTERFLDEMHGVLNHPANSGHKTLDHVLSGGGTYLGKGHESMVHDAGNGVVVKSAVVTPFHWNHGIREPHEANAIIDDQVKATRHLRSKGVLGILPQYGVHHDGRSFAVMPKVDTTSKLEDHHIQQLHDTLHRMHEAGYTLRDQVQAGLDHNRNAAIYDVGSVAALSSNERYRQEEKDDDFNNLQRLAEKHGVQYTPPKERSFFSQRDAMAYDALNRIAANSIDPKEARSMAAWLHSRHNISVKNDPEYHDSFDQEIVKGAIDKLRSVAGMEPVQWSRKPAAGQRSFEWDEDAHPRDELGQWTDKLHHQIKEYLSDGTRRHLRDVHSHTGHTKQDVMNPLSNPTNAALKKLRDSGEINSSEPEYGEPMFYMTEEQMAKHRGNTAAEKKTAKPIETVSVSDASEAKSKGVKRSKDAVEFTPAIQGPSGASLLSYDWKYMLVEEPNARGDDIVVRRVSDWDESDHNEHTGRDIVHVFHVIDKDGKAHSTSLETAVKLLGLVQDTPGMAKVRNLASAAIQLAQSRRELQKLIESGGKEYRIASARERVSSLEDRVKALTKEAEMIASGKTPVSHYRETAHKLHSLMQLMRMNVDGRSSGPVGDFEPKGYDSFRQAQAKSREVANEIHRVLQMPGAIYNTKSPIPNKQVQGLYRGADEPWSDAKIRNWYLKHGEKAEKILEEAGEFLKKNHPLYERFVRNEIHNVLSNDKSNTLTPDQFTASLNLDRRTADDKSSANSKYHASGRSVAYSYLAKTPDGKIVRVDGKDGVEADYAKKSGYEPISEPVQPEANDHKLETFLQINWKIVPKEILEKHKDILPKSAIQELEFSRQPHPHTQTPEFKAWHAGSHVVNEDGSPKVVYHGTRSHVTSFDSSKTSPGWHSVGGSFFFSSAPDIANEYSGAVSSEEGGNVIPAYVSIKNPYRAESLAHLIRQFGVGGHVDARRHLERLGHDGMILGSGKNEVVAAFRPHQIKSAIGNSGAFDPSDNRITFSREGEIGPVEFARKPSRDQKSFDFDSPLSGHIEDEEPANNPNNNQDHLFTSEIPPEHQDEAAALSAKHGGGEVRRLKNGDWQLRSPKGGKVSEVNGVFYPGGQFMPIHGIDSMNSKKLKAVKPKKAEDDLFAKKPSENGQQREKQREMTPEQIEALRRERELNKLWADVQRTPLGHLMDLGDKPGFKPKTTTILDNWRPFAEKVGPEAIANLKGDLERTRHAQIDEAVKRYVENWKETPSSSRKPSMDDATWEKDLIRDAAQQWQSLTPKLYKAHEKIVPGSHYVRELLGELIEDRDELSGMSYIERMKHYGDMLASLVPPPKVDASEARKHGYFRNRYDGRTADGKKVAAGDGWVKKNQAGNYETFADDDVLQAIRPVEMSRPLADVGPVEFSTHEFASTQFNLPPDIARKIKEMAKTIPSEELSEDGTEDNPHITIKYGLHDAKPDCVRKAVSGFGKVKVKLGKTSVFSVDQPGKHYDVLKVEVTGGDIHRLNKKIAAECEHTDTFPDYRPHVTIAYLQPGKGRKYAGDSSLSGTEIEFDSFLFSDKDREKTRISLVGNESEFSRHLSEVGPIEFGWRDWFRRKKQESPQSQPESPEPEQIHETPWTDEVQVDSSNVYSYAWEPQGDTHGNLIVRFKNKDGGQGPAYRYVGTPKSIYEGMERADSKGRFVWDNLRVRGTVSGHQYPYNLAGTGSTDYVPRQAIVARRGRVGEWYAPRTFQGQRSQLPEGPVRKSGDAPLPGYENRSKLQFKPSSPATPPSQPKPDSGRSMLGRVSDWFRSKKPRQFSREECREMEAVYNTLFKSDDRISV